MELRDLKKQVIKDKKIFINVPYLSLPRFRKEYTILTIINNEMEEFQVKIDKPLNKFPFKYSLSHSLSYDGYYDFYEGWKIDFMLNFYMDNKTNVPIPQEIAHKINIYIYDTNHNLLLKETIHLNLYPQKKKFTDYYDEYEDYEDVSDYEGYERMLLTNKSISELIKEKSIRNKENTKKKNIPNSKKRKKKKERKIDTNIIKKSNSKLTKTIKKDEENNYQNKILEKLTTFKNIHIILVILIIFSLGWIFLLYISKRMILKGNRNLVKENDNLSIKIAHLEKKDSERITQFLNGLGLKNMTYTNFKTKIRQLIDDYNKKIKELENYKKKLQNLELEYNKKSIELEESIELTEVLKTNLEENKNMFQDLESENDEKINALIKSIKTTEFLESELDRVSEKNSILHVDNQKILNRNHLLHDKLQFIIQKINEQLSKDNFEISTSADLILSADLVVKNVEEYQISKSKQRATDFIVGNKIERGFEEISSILKRMNSPKLENQFLVIKGNYNRLKIETIQGVIDDRTCEVRNSKILKSLLSFLDLL